MSAPILELQDISKRYGPLVALRDITVDVKAGQVTCILGDNGAGKSTLIKILSGVHRQSSGRFLLEGREVRFTSPRDALEQGIATVYQDLAVVALMPVWRNFFLGAEPLKRFGPVRRIDKRHAYRVTKEQLGAMGIEIRDVEQPVGTLSGGERQSVAIAKAAYFGAKVLILDEPTSALGVRQSGEVLRRIIDARNRGLAVILITHNPNHAFPVGDRFLILNRGESMGFFAKKELTHDRLVSMMSGGAELRDLTRELEESSRTDASLADAAHEFAAEVRDFTLTEDEERGGTAGYEDLGEEEQ